MPLAKAALAEALALDAGEPCGVRLFGLGLWDVYPDVVRYAEPAAAINALVRLWRDAGRPGDPGIGRRGAARVVGRLGRRRW